MDTTSKVSSRLLLDREQPIIALAKARKEEGAIYIAGLRTIAPAVKCSDEYCGETHIPHNDDDRLWTIALTCHTSGIWYAKLGASCL